MLYTGEATMGRLGVTEDGRSVAAVEACKKRKIVGIASGESVKELFERLKKLPKHTYAFRLHRGPVPDITLS